MQKLNNETFIIKANIIHNNRYDYNLVNYCNFETKIIIICPIHGEFRQRPSSHLDGSGCSICSNNERLDTDNFIKKAEKVHNFVYNYSKVNYSNNKTEIIIICPIHGEFRQRADMHLQGHKCANCASNRLSTTENFIIKSKEKHGQFYNYSKVNYIKAKQKVIIICPIHGEFNQIPNNHLSGAGCKHCNRVGAICKSSINKYNKFRKTKLYLVKFESIIDNETFYKIGVSYATKNRFSNREYGYKILNIYQIYGTLENMFKLEQYFKNQVLINLKYTPKYKMNGGKTECFLPNKTSDLDKIIKKMDEENEY